jgi:transposase
MDEPKTHNHTMSQELLYLGLDVHSQSISLAIAEPGGGEVRNYGTISGCLHSLEKTLAKIKKAHPGRTLKVCYEAGPTGFVIARRLAQLKVECLVAAPTLIPNRSGDRVKTDQRDALKLARLLRAGELTAVHVPDATDEAMRDLCRARTDAVQDLRRSRSQLKAFLLRHGYRYTGKSAWTEAHRRYLRELVLPHPAHRVVLEDVLRIISVSEERIARLEDQMAALLESWQMKPVVEALMGLRGFQIVGAMVMVSELGGAWRFEHPRALMAYLGLVPTENSSGSKRRQGAISKAGNSHARWLLIEAAHHYRLPPKVSKELSMRQQGLSDQIKQCSWKAQTRLHSRMMRLLARGKNRNKVTVAIARELTGFVWRVFQIMAAKFKPDSAQAAPAKS